VITMSAQREKTVSSRPTQATTRRSSHTTRDGRKRSQEFNQALKVKEVKDAVRHEWKRNNVMNKEQEALLEFTRLQKQQAEIATAAFEVRASALTDHVRTLQLPLCVDTGEGVWKACTALHPGATPVWALTVTADGEHSARFHGKPWSIVQPSEGADDAMISLLDVMAAPAVLCAGMNTSVAEERISAQGRNLDHISYDNATYRSRKCELRVPVSLEAMNGAVEDTESLHVTGVGVTLDGLKEQQHVQPLETLSSNLLGHYTYYDLGDHPPFIALVTKIAAAAGPLPAYVCLSLLKPGLPDMTVTAAVFHRDWQLSMVFNRSGRSSAWLRHVGQVDPVSCKSCRASEADARKWLAKRQKRKADPTIQRRLTAGSNNHAPISNMTPDSKKKRMNNHRKQFSRRAEAEANAAQVSIRRVTNLDETQVSVYAGGDCVAGYRLRYIQVLTSYTRDTVPGTDGGGRGYIEELQKDLGGSDCGPPPRTGRAPFHFPSPASRWTGGVLWQSTVRDVHQRRQRLR